MWQGSLGSTFPRAGPPEGTWQHRNVFHEGHTGPMQQGLGAGMLKPEPATAVAVVQAAGATVPCPQMEVGGGSPEAAWSSTLFLWGLHRTPMRSPSGVTAVH